MQAKNKSFNVDDLYFLQLSRLWCCLKEQHYAFWCMVLYLCFEFVRPQSIFPALDFAPWAQIFLVMAMIGIFFDRNIERVGTAADVFVSLFTVSILLSILFAIYPDFSKNNFKGFIVWVITYYLLTKIVSTRERLYICILVFTLAAGKIAIGTSKSWALRGFAFTDWGLMGPPGFFQNSGELAILMVMLFPLAYYLTKSMWNSVRIWERGFLMLFCICPVMTVLGASSRGSQLALLVQLGFMFRKSVFRIKPLVSLAAIIAAAFYLLPDEQLARFESAGDDKSSRQRLLYWSHGWEMMLDNPLTGVGYYNFIPYYEQHHSSDLLYEHAQLPHNILIQVGTDAGFFAVFSLLAIVGYCLIQAKKLTRFYLDNGDQVFAAIASGLGVGVIGFFIAGQFVTVTYYPFIWIHLAFIVCLSNVSIKDGLKLR